MEVSIESYQQFKSSIYNFIHQRIQDDKIVNDIIYNIAIRIQYKLRYLPDSEQLVAWLYRVTYNAIIDNYRNRSQQTNFDLIDDLESFANLDSQTEIKLLFSEFSLILIPLLSNLPSKDASLIELIEIQKLSRKEVSEQVSLKIENLLPRIILARKSTLDILLKCCIATAIESEAKQDFCVKMDTGIYC